ncbi:MAG: FAD-dependent oxidoreductase [Pseudohongiellaceae bacterium]
MTIRYSTDIAIFGGGIAGLWLLARLRNLGYRAILLESNHLGGGQTLASQGIIHGGLKYALSGNLSGAAQAIAAMPERWRDLLAGNAQADGDLDLSPVRVLSEHYYMWSDGGFRSRLKSFLGSKSLRGRIDPVTPADYPPPFADTTIDGNLYRLPDFVIDSESLLARLIELSDGAHFRIDSQHTEFLHDAQGQISGCRVSGGETTVEISAQRVLFTAGEGNAGLIAAAGLEHVQQQLRPLKMVCLTGPQLPTLFVHCIGSDFSMTPLLTITTHPGDDRQPTWYLGGELAETGVQQSDDILIARARELLARFLPWVDITGVSWQCLAINRAEAATDTNKRPDDAFYMEEKNTIVVWPTKFTLTPSLADRVSDHLRDTKIMPTKDATGTTLSSLLPAATVAVPRWRNKEPVTP